jgi:SAM-dependent methyltransferase
MFHQWGLQVEGSDLSPAMIAHARANFGEDERLRWKVRGFEQPIAFDRFREGEAPAEPFDAALCMGNSLALAPDLETAQRTIQQMFAAVRPGGIVMIQVLNLWQLPDGPCVWQKCKRIKSFSPEPTATALWENAAKGDDVIANKPPAVAVGSGLNENAENDVLILKGVHRSGSQGYVEFLAASIAEGKLLHHESMPFLGLEASQLEQASRAVGAKTLRFFGDYRQNPYQREKSVDLIMVVEK